MKLSEVPDWVTFPEGDWIQISPEEAGLDAEKLGQVSIIFHIFRIRGRSDNQAEVNV